MNAHRTSNRYGTASFALLCALGSIGLVGCTDPVAPPIQEPVDTLLAVVVEGHTTAVRAGGYIGVIVHTPDEGDAWFRTTVSWDPASFEHIRFNPRRRAAHVTESPSDGWIAVEDDTAPYLPKRQIVFLFRALVDANTSGFAVYMEDPGSDGT